VRESVSEMRPLAGRGGIRWHARGDAVRHLLDAVFYYVFSGSAAADEGRNRPVHPG